MYVKVGKREVHVLMIDNIVNRKPTVTVCAQKT